MKNEKFLTIISVLSLVIILIGTTFSYFTVNRRSEYEVVDATADIVSSSLLVAPLYIGNDLIPLNDSDVMTAYQNQRIDRYDYGACVAYTITLENNSPYHEWTYEGIIQFNTEHITNLNYMVLDENDDIYQDITEISVNTDQSLGPDITLSSNTSKVLTLIIWVPNYDRHQNSEDASGYFNASVSFIALGGDTITGSISG